MSKPKPADARQPVAISFLRYSDPSRQRKNDSYRRQMEMTADWCQRNKLTLDKTLHHAGSAFRGRHRDDSAALGEFLQDAQAGRFPHGSYLVIENLDRLSREEVRPAFALWSQILDCGINIQQLQPERTFRHDTCDMVDMITAILELSRGHSESEMKSKRAEANWNRAVELARCKGRMMTSRVPHWIDLDDNGQPQLNPKRAAVVRQIFTWAIDGFGVSAITKKLVQAGTPPFGERVVEFDAEGRPYFRKVEGKLYASGEWKRVYVRAILQNPACVGDFQPRDRDGKPKGKPIVGYYPPVVSLKEFQAVRASMRSRVSKPGRIGEGVASVFGGLLHCASDGSTYYVASYTNRGISRKRLLNRASAEGKVEAKTFEYPPFERALLQKLREIPVSEVTGTAPAPEPAVIKQELAWVQARRAEFALQLEQGDLTEIAEQLRKLALRQDELQKQLVQAEDRVAKPISATWRDVSNLVDLLDSADAADVGDVRMKLRSAIRRAIKAIWVLVVPRHPYRLASVQVFFNEDDRRRDYLIGFRPGTGGAVGNRPAETWVRSLASVAKRDDLDLRRRDHAAALETFLSGVDLAALPAAE
jgi:DNA invertase Pin-like site-specific DNA recombinase